MKNDYEIKNSKEVKLSEKVRFRCMRCGECCRHVSQTVVIEPVDAFRLAKFLQCGIEEFYDKYTDMFLVDEKTAFPVFTLKTTGNENSCIFLKGNRCTVQESKPRTCRLYPFWVHPCEDGFSYNYSIERRHHPRGSLVCVKDWMHENFREEDKAAMQEDWRVIPQIAGILKKLQPYDESIREFVLSRMLYFRHFAFELDKPFQIQFEKNNKELIAVLSKRLA
ncbi:YkgJ family cysteine cluster protein [Ructibacterium gallinarum]|uniref:YkgJ family cysteine cluster protein n=1 Tax=Ructibacterium gallinarum TaxID=2779355 RepID=A0A9D5M553_9FIRM|nr:YkgJ family cysteine cluster protein [Ructibacterium gallinarum]MBE5040790.1 YkgJ family cysteine cluster protein [Ructibacterium gallinarum]